MTVVPGANAAPAFPGTARHHVGTVELLVAVAAGSAPGELPGRGVAGLCASRGYFAHGQYRDKPLLPLWSCARGPTRGIGGPQQRLRMPGAMVIGRVEAAVKAAKDVRYAGSITGDLAWFLVIKGQDVTPRAHSPVEDCPAARSAPPGPGKQVSINPQRDG